jgi:hypothetical protein
VLKEWKRHFDSWKSAYDGVSRGVSFYTDLSEGVEIVGRSVISFYNSRMEERNEISGGLDAQETESGQRYHDWGFLL